MPANNYHFLEYWDLPGYTPGQVYEVLANATLLPDWWSSVFLEAEVLGDCTEPIVGAKARVKARGFLPYKVNFFVEALELEPGKLIVIKTSGDFDGLGRATLSATEHGTRMEVDWRVTVVKPLIRYLSPILKPLFALNHYWTTPRGTQGMLRFLDTKHN